MTFRNTVSELGQHRVVESGVVRLQAQRVLPVDPATNRLGRLVGGSGPPGWAERYGRSAPYDRLPKSKAELDAYDEQVGADGMLLPRAVHARTPRRDREP
ncbi:hypothetical protein [Embleya scabrispora]|uniref:hypothetical protein n=1 Tax=Embleya scabrispora TaxID=159449 RepID=UPI0039C86C1B